jgi:hypothetical protein
MQTLEKIIFSHLSWIMLSFPQCACATWEDDSRPEGMNGRMKEATSQREETGLPRAWELMKEAASQREETWSSLHVHFLAEPIRNWGQQFTSGWLDWVLGQIKTFQLIWHSKLLIFLSGFAGASRYKPCQWSPNHIRQLDISELRASVWWFLKKLAYQQRLTISRRLHFRRADFRWIMSLTSWLCLELSPLDAEIRIIDGQIGIWGSNNVRFWFCSPIKLNSLYIYSWIPQARGSWQILKSSPITSSRSPKIR